MFLLETVDARGVATLTLNRPDRHNAFDDGLIAELTASLRRMGERTDVRVVVLTGAGRSFSAGADLEWMRRMAAASRAANLADAAALGRLMHTLDRLPKPTIALVQGAAYAGGVGLVACCDIALASDRAVFCLSEVKLGIIPAAISPYVIQAIGGRQARRYFLTAEPFSAARAREIGLVHEVVPEAELSATLDRVIAALQLGGPSAQAAAKELVFLCQGRAIDAGLSAETAQRIAIRRASPEGREGLSAFLDKRPPNWVRTDV
jgi:methylglutaconyl-CoA hydratase